jgi:6-phosphofructokinase 1
MSLARRVGILTGGGDCPGLNAVIRAVVKAAQYHKWEVVGIRDGFEGLLELVLSGAEGRDRAAPLTNEDVRGILPRGGTILGTSNRGNPFAYVVQEGDSVRLEDRSDQVVQAFNALGLDALIVVGGDGSLAIGHRLQQKGLPVVGVPKTIDNDIAATDVTFGFDTALNTASEAIDRLHTTAESHHRVMVLEVMGRNAGWIAIEAGVAGGGDIILIPEIPFRVESVMQQVAERDRLGRHFSIVVVAEGACPLGGNQVWVESREPLAPARLGGIGPWLANELAAQTEREVRCTVLGHLQRGGSPTAFDRLLGTRFGVAALEAVAAGRFGQMVALRGVEVVAVPLEAATGEPKRVKPDGPLVVAARQLGISFGD